jgi:acetyltransferase EpsM
MKRILILGGLGNGSVIANAIREANMHGYNDYQCVGFLNDRALVGEKIDDFPVLGAVQNIKEFIEEGYFFINTILRIDGQKERLDMFKKLNLPEERLATFVHPSSYVAPNVQLNPGSVIMPHVAISSGTSIGKGSLIMVGATIGHDNIIGDYCHIAAQACVGAYLKIGIGVHIGLNATIREHLTIGDFSTIGMGAVLTKDVGNDEIWVGNPAKLLRMAQ